MAMRLQEVGVEDLGSVCCGVGAAVVLLSAGLRTFVALAQGCG